MGFRDSIAVIVPGWLQGATACRYLYAIAVQLDAFAEGLVQGVKARMPGAGIADGYAYIGNDRQIERGPNEDDAAYATRLSVAFDTWRRAGSARAVLTQLAAYLTPTLTVLRMVSNSSAWDTQIPPVIPLPGAQPTIAHYQANPPNWNWDGDSASWWRAWAIVYSSGSGAPLSIGPAWGSAGLLWGTSTRTWGSTATPDQVASVRALVRKWKAANVVVPWILVSFSSALFNPTKPPGDASLPDGSWGPWSKRVAGVQLATRSSSAIYWDGVV